MAAAEILNACLETGSEAAWTAFVQRFQPLIASSVARVVRRYGAPNRAPNRALIDDLIQETYLRLCKDECRSLRTFQAQHDEAIFGYLKVVATSVALDYYRARSAAKRRDEVDDDPDRGEASITSIDIEQSTILQQLDRRLAASESDRDRAIFWLYYRQGYTAREIATMPNLGLTQKGVESCLYRLTQLLRIAVNDVGKGKSPTNAFGELT